MTLNYLEWLFHDKMRFWPALLESERLNVRNSTTWTILRCSVHFTIYMYLYLYSYRRETARQLGIHAHMRTYMLSFLFISPVLFTRQCRLGWG